MSERIGVFGGTFDPPHIGHLVAAINARHELALDRVLFVIAHVPWQKVGTRDITPSAVRLAMVRAATADLDGIDASTIEIDRGGDSYTADTLAELSADGDAELFLIIGSDVAPDLDTWSRPEEVRQLATLAIVERPGSEGAEPPPGWKALRLDTPRVDLSSTELRARMSDDRPVEFLVPAPALAVWRRWISDPASFDA